MLALKQMRWNEQSQRRNTKQNRNRAGKSRERERERKKENEFNVPSQRSGGANIVFKHFYAHYEAEYGEESNEVEQKAMKKSLHGLFGVWQLSGEVFLNSGRNARKLLHLYLQKKRAND